MKKSKKAQISGVVRKEHVIDADGKILGRLSTEIVRLLRGKNKASFVRNIDVGDYVIIENIEKLKVSGKKSEQKIYYNYSGYPGGIKERQYKDVKSKDRKEVLEMAVLQMLPDTRLRNNIMKRLIIK